MTAPDAREFVAVGARIAALVVLAPGCPLNTGGTLLAPDPASEAHADQAAETHEVLDDHIDRPPDSADFDASDEVGGDAHADDVPAPDDAGDDGGGEACVPPDPPWWDRRWGSRRRLTVGAAPAGYTYRAALEPATTPSSTEVHDSCLPSGDDLRVVAWSASRWTDLDRHLELFARDRIVLWFGNVDPSAEYYLHYGQPAAAATPADPRNVFLWFDDFDRPDGDPGIGTLYDSTGAGTWVVSAGELRQTTYGSFTAIWPRGIADWGDIEVRYRWRPDVSGCPDSGPVLRWARGAAGLTGYYVERQQDRVIVFGYPGHTPVHTVSAPAPVRDWHEHVARTIGTRLEFQEDGAPLVSAAVVAAGSGSAGLATYCNALPYRFDDLRVRLLVEPDPPVVVGAEEHGCP